MRYMPGKYSPTDIPRYPDLTFESALWDRGVKFIAGIDEAGRGALAGPVVAGGVILPREPDLQARLKGVRDSKQMSPKDRFYWSQAIKETAICWAIGVASNLEIDDLGILPATLLAMRRALAELSTAPQFLLVDFLEIPGYDCPQTPLIKGDARSLSIAAASILAKTARDAMMIQLDQDMPDYGFALHKGYGTRAHLRAMADFGPSPLHRRSFHIRKGILDEERDT